MNCFGGSSKSSAGFFDSGPNVISTFALKDLKERDFGIHDLDLLETVGVGRFSRVRLCRDIKENKFLAIKILRKSKIVNLQQVDHVKNELYILSHIRSPFVVDLKAFFQDDNNLYFVTEFINGGELFSHIRKRKKLSVDAAKFISMEVACALQSVHDYGVVYRGAKPENIMLDLYGHIKLVDFGFAKDIGETHKTFTLCGTPEYLAPEALEGSGFGMAADWWALGILIFEMLAGYPPFFATNPFAVYRKILECKIKFPSGFDRRSKSVVSDFLQLNRGSRLGCSVGGFGSITRHSFYGGISWDSAKKAQVQPVLVPTVATDGDSSNFDYYAEEDSEVSSNLRADERELFKAFDPILDRPVL